MSEKIEYKKEKISYSHSIVPIIVMIFFFFFLYSPDFLSLPSYLSPATMG